MCFGEVLTLAGCRLEGFEDRFGILTFLPQQKAERIVCFRKNRLPLNGFSDGTNRRIQVARAKVLQAAVVRSTAD